MQIFFSPFDALAKEITNILLDSACVMRGRLPHTGTGIAEGPADEGRFIPSR